MSFESGDEFASFDLDEHLKTVQHEQQKHGEEQHPNSAAAVDDAEQCANFVKFYESTSEKGKIVLRRNGFEYAFDKCSKSENVDFWRCLKRIPYCPGRIVVQRNWHEEGATKYRLGNILSEQHNHNPVDPSIRDAQNFLRLTAQIENPLKSSKAIDMARRQMPKGVTAEKVPSNTSMARSYRNYVAKASASDFFPPACPPPAEEDDAELFGRRVAKFLRNLSTTRRRRQACIGIEQLMMEFEEAEESEAAGASSQF